MDRNKIIKLFSNQILNIDIVYMIGPITYSCYSVAIDCDNYKLCFVYDDKIRNHSDFIEKDVSLQEYKNFEKAIRKFSKDWNDNYQSCYYDMGYLDMTIKLSDGNEKCIHGCNEFPANFDVFIEYLIKYFEQTKNE